jgi:hypothetical protein
MIRPLNVEKRTSGEVSVMSTSDRPRSLKPTGEVARVATILVPFRPCLCGALAWETGCETLGGASRSNASSAP